ncbi:amidase [Yoonia maritima]|uniref:amidase n=1 Tax=Yoonia maritima TaxID=1435347 RepID=UPI000D0E45FC|nr:amidase [Yoonia maritima]
MPIETLNTLSATSALAGLRRGDFTALELTRACLGRIRARDGMIKAWLCLNPNAEQEAAQISPDDPRPLAGLPIGVKDVFDTSDMPTTYNSSIFADYQPALDAAAVMMLRAAGAIIIGKTDTTEFAAAGRDAASGNPANLAHTPGGSSAGSAAAVADFHVPLALATQTGGSTIRPASFCGIFGMKPSFGIISTEGMKCYAPSFDTVGFYGREISDLMLAAKLFDLPDTLNAAPFMLGVSSTPFHDQLTAPMAQMLRRVAELENLRAFDLPLEFERLDDLHRSVMFAEGAAAFLPLARTSPDDLHDDFYTRINSRTADTMRAAFLARDELARCAALLESQMIANGIDALVVPAAPGVAPLGRGPGNPIFNAMWTALQMPCVALPISHHGGLPIGIQLVGPRGSDGRLLEIAATLLKNPNLQEQSHAPT